MKFEDTEMARAVLEARVALAVRMDPTQVVTRAGTMLQMVRQGLRDMRETDQDRILLGFLGVVVFGSSMTLVMLNLKRHERKAFNSWYAPWEKQMKGDPLICYFTNLRNMVIHQNAPAIGIALGGFGMNMPPIGSITIDGLPLPNRHLGDPLDDTSMVNLCRLYLAYLERMFESFAPIAFAVQDRLSVAEGH